MNIRCRFWRFALAAAGISTVAASDKPSLPRSVDSSLGLLTAAHSAVALSWAGTNTHASLGIPAGSQTYQVLPPTWNGMVSVDVFPSQNGASLLSDLWYIGAQNCRVYPGVITGRVPISKVAELSQLPSVAFARANWYRTCVGKVTTQSDVAASAPLARGRFNVSGAGKRVGIISDSFNTYGGLADGVACGDLPASIDIVLDAAGYDEGRAMAEVIHDTAPGASVGFHAAGNGQQDLAHAFLTLAGLAPDSASRRCDVIVDDIAFYSEPMFADGVVSQAINAAKAAGISVFSAAGNDASNSFDDGPWLPSGVVGASGGVRHQFNADPSNPQTLLPIAVGFGVTTFVLQWADAYKSTAPASPSNLGAYHDIDIFLHHADGSYVLDANGQRVGSFTHNIGNDPVEIFSIIRLVGGLESFALSIEYAGNRDNGSAPASGSLPAFKIVWSGDATVTAFPAKTGKSTIYGHANAAGANAVGAVAYYNTPPYGRTPVPQSFSSLGGTPIYTDALGAPLASPVIRSKPDFCAPDGGNTSFFYQDSDGDAWPNFVGTSAAAATAAATAALLLEAKPTLSPDALASALRSTATDMLSTGFDFASGHGLINAAAAVQSVTTTVPALVGDLDSNGCVGLSDLTILQQALAVKSTDPRFDINKDGRLTVADVRSLALRFTNPTGICP